MELKDTLVSNSQILWLLGMTQVLDTGQSQKTSLNYTESDLRSLGKMLRLLNEKQQIYMHQLTQDPAEGPNALWLSTPKPSSILKGKHFWEQMWSLKTRPA